MKPSAGGLKPIFKAVALIPGIVVDMVKDAGHIVTMDQPECVNEKVLEFLGTGWR